MKFIHDSLPQRIVFAPGDAADAVAREVEQLGASRVMVIASGREAELADRVAGQLPVVLRHTEVVMHVPVDVAERARDAATAAGADVLLSVGGGSTTGLAKAVALTTGLPVVAVPTTYAGSEATNVWGLTDDAEKTTGVDNRVLPKSVVYDAELLTTLPAAMAVASGLNALAHCIDSMWGPRTDPLDRVFAAEGIRALTQGLPAVAGNPSGVDGISGTLYGAYLAAASFSSAGSGMHHKICHVLGGMFNLPHAETHAVVLPYVLAYNVGNAPEAEAMMARAFGAPTATAGLAALREAVSAPASLKDIGMSEDGIAAAVAPVLAAVPADNPTPVTAESLTALLTAAWRGDDPEMVAGF